MIAISYRREDSLPTAGRLYDRLQAKFGKENVFMDFDSIPPGMDFREQIKQMIERSKLVIAIIGPHWLGEQPDASRRIDNPADFVRLEIAYALQRGIPVIPVLVNNTPMPPPEKLPQEIEGLAFRNALILDTGIDFHHHADRLITGIGKAMDIAPRSRGLHNVPEPTASAAHRPLLRKITAGSAAILLAVALLALVVWYFVTHKPQPAKQVATASTSPTPPLVVKPPVEQLSPSQLAVEQPKPVVEQSFQPQITNATSLDFASISKEHPYVNSLGMKFVPVPGTSVLFSIWDTRVKDYKVFAEAVKHEWPKPTFDQTEEHAAVNVSWNDATAFCEWLTEKEQKAGLILGSQRYRLPTDSEWSTAVGKSKYPWGDEWPPPQGAGSYGLSHASRVGNYKPNLFGLYDMGGNVWQWCEDWYHKEMNEKVVLDKFTVLQNDGGGRYRVARGASWNYDGTEALLSSYRDNVTPDYRNVAYGFRCVLSDSEIGSTKDQKSSAPLESLSQSASANEPTAQTPNNADTSPIAQLTGSDVKILSAPQPPYPHELEAKHVGGSGRFEIDFDESGNAKSVDMPQTYKS